MAGAPDAPLPNFFGKPSAKRPKRSPAKAVTLSQMFTPLLLVLNSCTHFCEDLFWNLRLVEGSQVAAHLP